ncbi:hypothetical protein MEM_02769, partial [Candida albicans L26]
MKLESIAVFAGIVSTALAGVYHKPPPATTYWTTIYAPSTSVVTVTSCSKGGCGTQSYATGVTKTKTVHEGVTTEYTTYCPLTTSHEVVKSTCSDTLVVWSTRSFSWVWSFSKPDGCGQSTSTIKTTAQTDVPTTATATPSVSTTCTTGTKTKWWWVIKTTDCSVYTVSSTSSSL